MTNEAFEIGDKVALKTGGPDMVIKDIDSQGAICIWHNGKNFEELRFEPRTLQKLPISPTTIRLVGPEE